MTGDQGRGRWDDRYREGDWTNDPRAARIVEDAEAWLPREGLALDVACGAGRNALHLAERGLRVLAVDRSLQGLRLLRRRVGARFGLGPSPGGARNSHGVTGPDRNRPDGAGPNRRRSVVPVLPVLADAARFAVRPESFDVVVNTHFLLREAFPLLRTALAPGGLLLFETFHVDELDVLGGDIRRAYALERGELRRAFEGFEVLLYEEGVFQREEGERGLARMVARKG